MKFPTQAAMIAGLCYLCLSTASHAVDIGSMPSATPQAAKPSGSSFVLSDAIASPEITPWTRLSVPVASCAVPPAIDGRLDDPCWRTATHHAGFYPAGDKTPIDSVDQTEVWVCADKERLYIAFHCLHRQPGDIHTGQTKFNADLSHDDYVAVDIDSEDAHKAFSTVQVSARGTRHEKFENGAPDSTAATGDWESAVQPVPGGWTAEISIPFQLLQYHKGASEFGLDFYRNVSHNGHIQCWPFLPPEGATDDTEGKYLSEFTGLAPVNLSRPIFYPFTIAAMGQGGTLNSGFDFRDQVTDSLNTFGAVRPDFRYIPNDIPNIDFSYDEKSVDDERPFFLNDDDSLPDGELLYTPRIGQIDGGVRAVDQEGGTKTGIIGTETVTDTRQYVTGVHVAHSFDPLSSVEIGFLRDRETDMPSNTTAMLEGTYGWTVNRTPYALEAQHFPSWLGGQSEDGKDTVSFSNVAKNGQLGVNYQYSDIGPNFISRLGYNPEVDLKGNILTLSQSKEYSHGTVEHYILYGQMSSFQHHTGGFFHDGDTLAASIQTRSGEDYMINYNSGSRNEVDYDNMPGLSRFHDHDVVAMFQWGTKTGHQQGGIQDSFGEEASQAYNYFSVYENLLAARNLFLYAIYSRLKLGDTITTQTISTFTYVIDDANSVTGRSASQGSSTSVYVSYGHRVRSGDDYYLIFGDPNSLGTVNMVSLKLVHPIE